MGACCATCVAIFCCFAFELELAAFGSAFLFLWVGLVAATCWLGDDRFRSFLEAPLDFFPAAEPALVVDPEELPPLVAVFGAGSFVLADLDRAMFLALDGLIEKLYPTLMAAEFSLKGSIARSRGLVG
eukprot:CAMPEP_0119562542 /NCGR_PEP_ID=MMETSP1352-20130426/20761_1 /TAXON_ID=265584 /ORGANISM="Stauroneis constricta, Strain CCMP1120" /LENGTH=127 /DNA_ID=CAMNT_0007610971 /DNA_START=99 /DNA_END=479 /DNA_ORIENTATION=+